jgi:hypothetical protein
VALEVVAGVHDDREVLAEDRLEAVGEPRAADTAREQDGTIGERAGPGHQCRVVIADRAGQA